MPDDNKPTVPNSTDPSQLNNSDTSGTGNVVVPSPTATIPDEGSSAPTPFSTNPVPTQNQSSSGDGNQGQSNDPYKAINAPHAPQKYGGKKIIATIFGILFILGAVATGVYLVQTQQLKIGQAWDCSRYNFSVSREGVVTIQNGSTNNEPLQQAKVYINGNLVATLDVPALSPGGSATLGTVSVPSQQGFTWRVDGTVDCEDSGNYAANTPTPSPTSVPTLTVTPPPSVTLTPSLTPTITPKPTLPPIGAVCLNVQAYDTDWNLLSISDLSQLSVGDEVRFTVAGMANNGTFDKARFTINGVLRPEVKTQKPSTDEFYDEYTIPVGVTSFTISAQIHHSELGWF